MAHTRAIFRVDYLIGNDAARTNITGCNIDGLNSVARGTKTAHGLVTGGVISVTAGTYIGDWLIHVLTADTFTLHSAPAEGYIYSNGTPAINDSITIGGNVFLFKALRSGANEITISSNEKQLAENIALAIQTDAGGAVFALSEIYRPTVDVVKHRVLIVNRIPGTSGNSTVFTKNCSALTLTNSGTLLGGLNLAYTIAQANATITPYGGSSWVDSWKTGNLGPTAARINPLDVIIFKKTAAPILKGTGKWTSRMDLPSPSEIVKNIVSSTNTSPIQITANAHGFVTGDIVHVTAHTVNLNANGYFRITYVGVNTFSLDNTVGSGVGGATGTVTLNNERAVITDSNWARLIEMGNYVWTVANGSTTAMTAWASSGHRENGIGSPRVTFPNPTVANTKYYFKSFPVLDLSSYQQLSFNFNSGTVTNVGTFKICLCSDTNGDVIVDTFLIPALSGDASNGQPLVLSRVGNGNLGSSIQSIAIYSDSVTIAVAKWIEAVSISATKLDGFNIQSGVSRNPNEVGVGGGIYVPRVVRDNFLLLESHYYNRGFTNYYYTESLTSPDTVNIYLNQFLVIPFVTQAGAIGTGGYLVSSKAGTILGETISPINYQFGFDDNERQIGVTNLFSFWGTTNTISHAHININRLSLFRCDITLSGNWINVDTVQCMNNPIMSLMDVRGEKIIIDYVYYSIWCEYGYGIRTGNGAIINGAEYIFFINCAFSGPTFLYNINRFYLMYGPQGSYFTIENSNINSIPAWGSGLIKNTIRNCTIIGEPAVNYIHWSTKTCILNNDNIEGNNWVMGYMSLTNWQTTIKSSVDSIGSWKLQLTNIARNYVNPERISLAMIPVNANQLVTVKCFIKKEHATNLTARLILPLCRHAGQTVDIFSVKNNDTAWQEVSISFTPTKTTVVEVFIEAWCVSGTGILYFSPITITQ